MIQANSIWNKKEKIYILDWLKIKNKSYDFILWDLVLLLGNQGFQKSLLSNLRSNLSTDWEILFRGWWKLYDNGLSLKEIINNCKNIDLETLNYICYEWVVGLWYTTQEISTCLEKNNFPLFIFFKENFSKLVPYWTTKVNNIYILEAWNSIYRKNFKVSYEEILMFK